MKKLHVPFYPQKNSFTCGPASLQMVFAFAGRIKNQNRIKKEARTNPIFGTTHQNIIKTAQKEGFYCYVNEDSTLHEVRHFIDQGFPIIVNYVEPTDNEGHFAVISGYTKRSIILNDPWNGKNFQLSNIAFTSRWHDHLKKKRYNRWIMVLSKKEFNLGREYKPFSKRSPS